MGYPAFIQPSAPLTAEQIAAEPSLAALAKDPRTKRQLLDGNPGEEHWHRLPAHLRTELEEFVENYLVAEGEPDPPCFWLDMNTRLCKHHKYRPRVCRDFAVGGRGCTEWRNHYADQIVQLK
jgi:Fe-S-cluster containining protein